MTNGHHAVILWLEYVDACFPFRRKPGCHYAWYLVPKHSCSFLGVAAVPLFYSQCIRCKKVVTCNIMTF
ncbi:hypothetical protein TSPI_03641 [Trichinella spiralis]|uniref:PiggyBac transposable element-derived protein domain-containing protein n=1 Tax=Trichinella spiralis TaxID=6334 RepID=A0ABR3KVG2_TRISP